MITVFHGMKMIAICDHTNQWWWVEKHCTYCGECCDDQGPMWRYAQDDICGGCEYLVEHESGDRLCGFKTDRPFSCSINDPHTKPAYCKVRFRKVDIWELITLIQSVGAE